jgi:NADPH:quinone reductase
MMQVHAVRIHTNGGPEVLGYEAVECARLQKNQVRIRQTAIGVNFIDIHHRSGRYPNQGFPLVLGMEGAGNIEDIGSGVQDFKIGDRVAYFSHSPGAYIQVRTIAADRVVKLPDFIDDATAAAVMLKGLTVQSLLRGSYPVRAGETILVHAAAGGIGLLMCQWARHLGVRVIGTVGSEEKRQLAREHGCDHVIVYAKEDVVARVRELTDGTGVPVVYDAVGASTFDNSLACLRERGMLVSFGTASGPIPPFDLFRLNRLGSLYVTSASVFTFTRNRGEYVERTGELFEMLRIGALRIAINHRYPLADAAQAHRDLQARRTTGCIILVP